MAGYRLRLKDYERAYLLRLVHADIENMHRELIGKPILKLIAKLEATDPVNTQVGERTLNGAKEEK